MSELEFKTKTVLRRYGIPVPGRGPIQSFAPPMEVPDAALPKASSQRDEPAKAWAALTVPGAMGRRSLLPRSGKEALVHREPGRGIAARVAQRHLDAGVFADPDLCPICGPSRCRRSVKTQDTECYSPAGTARADRRIPCRVFEIEGSDFAICLAESRLQVPHSSRGKKAKRKGGVG